jgi:glycosyltransferase involved in cell wall biosynthesis
LAGSGSHTLRRPLRIALVAPPYFTVPPSGYGGVESVVADLADALVAHGHQVTLLGAGRSGTAAEFVPVWESPIPERLGEAYPEVVHAASVRRAIERIAVADGLEIVHDHTQAGPLNAPAYARLGLPTVVTMHGAVDEDVHRVYSALDDVYLVAISQRQRELAPELNWIATVHNAVRPDDWPYQPDKGNYGLFLGRFHPDKGAHLALDAAHAAGLPLVLAGKCAERAEQEYFEREVRPRLGAADCFAGVADTAAKRRLLAGARCLLFPVQWEEPFGMVMIEAMACGTPVVALSRGAVPEVVADGVTGIICDDPRELADAVRRVASIDPAACRKRVAEHFGTDTLAAGYETAYRTVLSCGDSVLRAAPATP